MPELTPQQKAALDYKSHISLTANAGSGKTFVMSKRFVEILLNEGIELSTIVAITFTDKAAGELYRKIASEIDLQIISEPLVEKQKLLENYRRQLVSANISTMHSFCMDLLKEFAPEAGIDASFSVIDKQNSDELIILCIEETLNSLIRNQKYAEDLKYLIRFFGSKKIFASQLEYSINHRGIIKQLEKNLYSKDADEIFKYFRNMFDEEIKIIFSNRLNSAINSFKRINEFVVNYDSSNKYAVDTEYVLNQANAESSIRKQINLLEQIVGKSLTNDLKVRKPGYLSKQRENFTEDISIVESLFPDLSHFFSIGDFKSENELIKLAKSFINIFGYTLNLYGEKKNQKSQLDFEDLLLLTKRILDKPEVRSSLSEKSKYIMIDEYQDTNELQYEIFMPLLDDLKKGNLFVVGDEKQSIYMFRNAELEIFSKTKNEITNHGKKGKLLDLPHSFRMSSQLVLFTNKLFSTLFKNANALYNEVEYNELICARDDNQKSRIEILLAEKNSDLHENELVAQKIIYLRNNLNVQLKDIAILCRKRESFAELERIFTQTEIPYSIIGGKGFYQRQTIYDIYNYLSFLLNNENDVALIGILRSPFFNLSDVQLYEISFCEGDSFYEKLKNYVERNTELKIVYELLNENLRISTGADIYFLVRKLLVETNYWSVIGAKQNAMQEIANTEKILSQAREFAKKSFKNLYDFTVFLKESIDQQIDEGQAQISRDENTVKILTIHQAKGLEFKAVFLYACNDIVRDNSVKAKTLVCDKKYGLITKVPIENNYFEKYSTAPIIALYDFINQKKINAEVKRLLYVGVTRAIDYLFISATHKDFKSSKGSFYELILEGLNSDFSKDEITLSSNVKFMKFDANKYKFYEKFVTTQIVITKNLSAEPNTYVTGKFELPGKEIFIQNINDMPKGEIISATKISMFSQCPVKYQLTYELGYSTVNDLQKNNFEMYDFNSNEDDELKKYAQLKGKIIHSLLRDNIKIENISSFIMTRLSLESFLNYNLKVDLSNSISEEMHNFYNSKTYAQINEYNQFRNEFEVYCREGEHYLYGIIDKLIYKHEGLIIVDYKTDNVSKNQINERTESYIPQLMFYAYILSKLYQSVNNITLQIVFLKHPEEIKIIKINREDLIIFGSEIRNSINKIHTSDFKPNLQHCSKCHFASGEKKCIKPF